MLKKRIIAILTGIAITIAVAGVSGLVADSLGLSLISPVYACSTSPCNCNGGGSGGGC
jgi:hypothetical protein